MNNNLEKNITSIRMRLSVGTGKLEAEDSILGIIPENPLKSNHNLSGKSNSLSDDDSFKEYNQENQLMYPQILSINKNKISPNALSKTKSTEIKHNHRFKSIQVNNNENVRLSKDNLMALSRLNTYNNNLLKKKITIKFEQAEGKKTKERKTPRKRRSTIQVTDLKKVILNFAKQQTNKTSKGEHSRVSQTNSRSKDVSLFDENDSNLAKLLNIYKKEIKVLREKNRKLEEEKSIISVRLEKLISFLESLH
jgi:hypothetical protein